MGLFCSNFRNTLNFWSFFGFKFKSQSNLYKRIQNIVVVKSLFGGISPSKMEMIRSFVVIIHLFICANFIRLFRNRISFHLKIIIISINAYNIWIPFTSNKMESFLINNCISCVCQFQQTLWSLSFYVFVYSLLLLLLIRSVEW